MNMRLSSSLTFWYKFGAPLGWAIAAGFFVREIFWTSDSQGVNSFMFFAVALLIALVPTWFYSRLVVVSLRNDRLWLSNFHRTAPVPVQYMEKVTGSLFLKPDLIRIHFDQDTEFGAKIVFMPRYRFWRGISVHPTVTQLREIVGSDAKLAPNKELQQTGDK
ncbi:MAG: hypothetical protein AAF385_06420, partial [Pseudomonadota bacterium]